MAETSTNLGRVSVVPKGEYDPAVQYQRLDLLQYNGAGYLALRTVQGVTPVNGDDYMLLADQGADGVSGPAGPAGPGVPTGGAAGQVLAKNTTANYDTHWIDPPEGGGTIELPVSIENGGTGASTAYNARNNLGLFLNVQFYGGMTISGVSGTKPSLVVGDMNMEAAGLGAFAHGYYGVRATGTGAYAGGYNNVLASGEASHAEGEETEASASCAHAEGWGTKATGESAHAGGALTIAAAEYQTALGVANVESTNKSNKFIIGKGTWTNSGGTITPTRANCFRVTDTGVSASGSYNASGADYAEMFEWADGNQGGEDRAGRFVTLDGAKIRLAGPEDDYIIGVVSGNPSVVGDVHDDQWQGMYLYDIFGRPLWEDVEVPEELLPDGTVIRPAHTDHRQKLNPDYDNSQEYQPRSERPEWDAVGLLGKLVAVDDGSCVANGWCTVGEGGIAVSSDSRTKYRVMERLDDSHVRILIL